MTLLDDFEARYKLLGVQVVSAMLEHVPPSLLNRTGISGLILAVWFGLFLWCCADSNNAHTVPKSRTYIPPLAFHACCTAGRGPCSGESHRTHDRVWLGTALFPAVCAIGRRCDRERMDV